MKRTILMCLALGLGLGGCATGAECENRVADLQRELQKKDTEIQSLRAADAKLKTSQGKASALAQALSQELQNEINRGNVTIEQLKDRLTVSVLQEVLFVSGSAEINTDGKSVLDRVAKVLKDIDDQLIMVEGRTDDVPIGEKLAEKFPTNWELSTARATAVVRHLQDKGVSPNRLGAAGFSEYRPVAPNDTAGNRQKNRRIDIVLTSDLQERKSGS